MGWAKLACFDGTEEQIVLNAKGEVSLNVHLLIGKRPALQHRSKGLDNNISIIDHPTFFRITIFDRIGDVLLLADTQHRHLRVLIAFIHGLGVCTFRDCVRDPIEVEYIPESSVTGRWEIPE